jgi:hypothetical protein
MPYLSIAAPISASTCAAWPVIARAQASRIAGLLSYVSCTIVPARQVNLGSGPFRIDLRKSM